MKWPAVLILACLASPYAALAEDTTSKEKWYEFEQLYFQAGTYVHYSSSKDHAGNNLFGALEAHKANDWFYGLALFDNSFGQFSQYLYAGKRWHFPRQWQNVHFKLSAGIIHGYKEPWDNKIPVNTPSGWGLGLIPSLGYQNPDNGWGADMIFLGNSALLFTIGKAFDVR